MENELEPINEPIIEEEVVLDEPQVEEEDTTDWKAEALKHQAIAQRYKTRLDKVKIVPDEGEKVEVSREQKPEIVQQGLSTKDTIALIKNNVNEEDVSEVEDYARYRGISVSEALKSSVVKTLLSEREDQRKTANATNVGNTRRGPSKPTPQDLIERASKGQMPESDEDIRILARAEFEAMRNKNK